MRARTRAHARADRVSLSREIPARALRDGYDGVTEISQDRGKTRRVALPGRIPPETTPGLRVASDATHELRAVTVVIVVRRVAPRAGKMSEKSP